MRSTTFVDSAQRPAVEEPVASGGAPGTVVFVGVGMFPHRIAGDKNFLLELASHLQKENIEPRFISIVNGPDDLPPSGRVTYVNRFLHYPTDRYVKRDESGAIVGYRHPHGPLRTWAELTSTLLRSRGALRRSLRTCDRAVIHWMDSSLVIPSLRLACGERHRYVSSVYRYSPQHPAVVAMRTAALNRAHCVLTGTEAARERLIRDGCSADKVMVEPWGCSPRAVKDTDPAPDGQIRILWSGFLQQIGRADLLRCLELAARVRRDRSDISFTFSLKPECFEAEYAAWRCEGVDVRAGGSSFIHELPSFDAFLSPVLNNRSTPAPALTWLEALACGVPIITTDHPGVREVVTHDASGIVASNYEALYSVLMDRALKARLRSLRPGARAQHRQRYDIGDVARRYAAIYRKLLAEG